MYYYGSPVFRIVFLTICSVSLSFAFSYIYIQDNYFLSWDRSLTCDMGQNHVLRTCSVPIPMNQDEIGLDHQSFLVDERNVLAPILTLRISGMSPLL